MQQELIEMLEKMIEHFNYISTDSYYAKETGTILSEAEKLIEKAKNNNAPAVPQEEGRPGIPLRKAYKHLLIVAPAQEIDKSVADAEIKAMYVASQGSDKGWLGIEGSYFIGGVVAARKQQAAPAPAQEVGLTDEERADMACAVAAICTGTSSRTIAATAIDWTERALRAKGQS